MGHALLLWNPHCAGKQPHAGGGSAPSLAAHLPCAWRRVVKGRQVGEFRLEPTGPWQGMTATQASPGTAVHRRWRRIPLRRRARAPEAVPPPLPAEHQPARSDLLLDGALHIQAADVADRHVGRWGAPGSPSWVRPAQAPIDRHPARRLRQPRGRQGRHGLAPLGLAARPRSERPSAGPGDAGALAGRCGQGKARPARGTVCTPAAWLHVLPNKLTLQANSPQLRAQLQRRRRPREPCCPAPCCGGRRCRAPTAVGWQRWRLVLRSHWCSCLPLAGAVREHGTGCVDGVEAPKHAVTQLRSPRLLPAALLQRRVPC